MLADRAAPAAVVGRPGRVAVHRSPSADAGGRFEDGFFDWVYIDADHSYVGVSKDITAAAPKVNAHNKADSSEAFSP